MGLEDIKPPTDEGHKGQGGLWGSIAGGLLAAAGAVAAPFTAGTSLAAVPAGLALAGAAAPVVGNAIDPSVAGSNEGVVPHTETNKSALDALSMHPEVQLAGLQQSRDALKSAQGLPAEQVSTLNQMFTDASGKLKNQLGINS